MPSERFEWLETEIPVFSIHSPPLQATRGKRCPRCQWLDYAHIEECFRCGYLFEKDPLSVFRLQQLKIDPLPLKIQERPPGSFFFQGKIIPFALYQLSQASEQQQLLPGFETLISLPQLKIQYFKHQIETCLKALRDLRGQAILADEVGLGKTVEAGIILKELVLRKLVHQVLILLPAHLIPQWQGEMYEKFGEVFIQPERHQDWNSNRLILSLSKARGSAKSQLLERKFDLIIVDEAHKLKNKGTQQYELVQALPKKYVLFLSATPFHNRLSELYNLVNLIKPGLLGTRKSFHRYYLDTQNKAFPKTKNIPHLKQLLQHILLRNSRKQTGVSIPKRRAATYHLHFFPEEQQYYRVLCDFLSKALENLGDFEYPVERSAQMLILMTLQREICSSIPAAQQNLRTLQKRATPALSQKIQELLELGYEVKRFRKAQACLEILQQFPGKFLIFTEFKATVHFLVHFFQQAGYHALPFTGDLNPFQRMETIQQFKTKADLLISTNSGGEGLNIQFASRLINYDLPWNPMIVEQRIGRIHRLGQENEVFIFNLSVYETIEAKILELLTHKIRIFQIAIGELDLILGTLHPEKSFEELVKTYWLDSLKSPSSNELPRSWKELESTLESASEEYQKIKKNEALLSVLLETPSSPTGKE